MKNKIVNSTDKVEMVNFEGLDKASKANPEGSPKLKDNNKPLSVDEKSKRDPNKPRSKKKVAKAVSEKESVVKNQSEPSVTTKRKTAKAADELHFDCDYYDPKTMPEIVTDDRLTNLFLPLTDDQRDGLESDITTHGCIDPIIVFAENVGEKKVWSVADGITRYQICKEAKVPFKIYVMEFTNIAVAAKWRIERHKNRRHLNQYTTIVSVITLFEGELSALAKQNLIAGGRKSHCTKGGKNDVKITPVCVATEIACLAETNPEYVRLVRKLLNDASKKSELFRFQLERGEKHIKDIKAFYDKPKKADDPEVDDDDAADNGASSPDSVLPTDQDIEKFESMWKIWEVQMQYDSLVKELAEKEPDPLDPATTYHIGARYVRESKTSELALHTLKEMEKTFRIGYVRGKNANDEEVPTDYFKERSDSLVQGIKDWFEGNSTVGSPNVMADAS